MRNSKINCVLLAALLCIGILTGCGEEQESILDKPPSHAVSEESTGNAQTGGTEDMKMEIQVNGETFTAVLSDSLSGRALMDLLPMTVDMKELNGNEKF